ncbi:MAG: hypothetical protein V4649_08225 [Bacteroidota bacterium]
MKLFRCVVIAAIVLAPYASFAQGGVVVPPKTVQFPYAPREFYITDVVDDRENTGDIGTVKAGRKEALRMQGGAAGWLSQFIATNVSYKKSGQPITLHILKLESEIKQKGAKWQVSTAISLAFYSGATKIIGYSGKSQGETSKSPDIYITEYIVHALETDFKRFDEWWPANKGKVPLRADVKINVVLAQATDRPGCIAFDKNTPLQIDDFKGPPEDDVRELAATYSGITVGYAEHVENGQSVLDITVIPYFDKSKSWFKLAGKTPYVLAHEQAHLDITAIKACELAEQFRKSKLTRDNFAQAIQQMQQDNAKATSDEEELYDAETAHGTITAKQVAWEKKVKQQLNAVGCY